MSINFGTAGTDKRQITIKFENEKELCDFITSLSMDVKAIDWIYQISVDTATLVAVVQFYL